VRNPGLAFGVASGLGAVAGLYGSICVGFFASLFGGTPIQISEKISRGR
jgi:sulfate permease, SulP family